jgi:ElaB/YqjD/DUF883 family membrane-anchored ribosome-binding protein
MSNMSNAAHDPLRQAKGAARDAGKAAAAASSDIQDDLVALRDDVARLTQQIANMVAARGRVTWRKAKSNVEGAIGDAQDKGMEAVDALRAAGDNTVDAIDALLKKRPYTTLGLAIGLGFLFGAIWRR